MVGFNPLYAILKAVWLCGRYQSESSGHYHEESGLREYWIWEQIGNAQAVVECKVATSALCRL